jgi:hypothetical protein
VIGSIPRLKPNRDREGVGWVGEMERSNKVEFPERERFELKVGRF